MIDETRRQLLSRAALALPVGAAALAVGDTVHLSAQKKTQSATALVNTMVPGTGGFIGTLTLTGFNVVNGVLTAAGTLTGNVLNADGTVLGSVTNQAVTAPAAVSASCSILSLTLGPLHLNLLGLVIDLNQVVLNITAVPGAGNLLGNLLCSVADLLNGGGALSNLLNSLAGLLNQILGAL